MKFKKCDELLPNKVSKALITLGAYCSERDCMDCAFAQAPKDDKHRVFCPFEYSNNPAGAVELVFREE